jgi:hypothetical protein
MAGSSVEREIRNTVIDKVRQFRPGSRIIHELNTAGTGSPRADLAVVGPAEILLFEIKSERDVLKRLEHQWKAFNACSHQTFLVLDRKFFIEKEYANGAGVRYEPTEFLSSVFTSPQIRNNVWTYPEPKKNANKYMDQTWKFKSLYDTPCTRAMLNLLWRAELVELCQKLSLPYMSRDNMAKLTERLILGATGRQITEGVCQSLRTRKFAEADEI